VRNTLVAAALVSLAASSTVSTFGTFVDATMPEVVYKSKAELMAVLAERAKATPAPEMMAANVKSGEGYMLNVVRRTKPQGAIAHDVGTEIHSVIDGSATLVTGGTISRPANPEERRNGVVQNGVTKKVGPGDVALVPPQTPHWYSAIDGVVTYLEIRFDVGAPAGGPAIMVTDNEIKSTLAQRAAATTPAPLMFAAPIGRGDKYQANIVKRTKPQGGGAHEKGDEVHHILEGSGTLVTGGQVVRGSGPNAQSTIEGGTSRKVSAGDVVLIPANTPHWYSQVDGSVRYLEVRFDRTK
jgi:mannose-6-phosphate isomerase-like protein (cupin superfamily)